MTRAERRNHWQGIIENQSKSGMNIADYCRDAQIRPTYFYRWRRRLSEQACTGGFLELVPDKLADATSGIRIRLDAKIAIEVQRGFDPATLRAVVETLSRCLA
jgi:transposase-like protein